MPSREGRIGIDLATLERHILFEGDGLIVVNKPFDLPTSGRSLDDPDCLQHAMMARARRMVWAVHQLDADTSGVVVFVRRKALVAEVAERMKRKRSAKRYLAVVHGTPGWSEHMVKAPIGKVDACSLGVIADGKPAKTGFRVLATGPQHTLVEARLFTGRTHQIRIHAAHLGHPLVGEEWYRDPPCTEHVRQALHAWRLELAGDPPTVFEAPIPEDLTDLLARLQIR